jgi:hypothetical protein
MSEKKKVFSKVRCREVLLIKGRWSRLKQRDYESGGWYAECEGKTKEEIHNDTPYGVDEDWMVDA